MKGLVEKWKALGPGILFAGTAIGVSHLVQSTRAGADYGWTLWWAILAANLFKYPFFEIGSRYAAATGESILEAYLKQGRVWLWLYAGLTISSMFAVTAAVGLVTGALIANLSGGFLDAQQGTVLILSLGALVLWVGGYHGLDRSMKILGLILVVVTLWVFVLALSGDEPQNGSLVIRFDWSDRTDFFFLIALMGWMPTALDLSSWNSLWTLEKAKDEGRNFSMRQVLFDFRLGYLISAGLAFLFLGIGALLLFGRGENFPDGAIGFTEKLIQVYTTTLGGWSRPLILISSLSIMISTSFSVLDGFGRVMDRNTELLVGVGGTKGSYRLWISIVLFGGLSLIYVFPSGFKPLIDLATTLSFIIAPVIAFLNMRALRLPDFPEKHLPGVRMRILIRMGFLFLILFTLGYLGML
ncbi:MAG: divalent metal cation transporter, partial [Bacteroidota bacterium]|nr:divalent metal cation transporter [Bacteroidota bacterium]